MSKKDPFKYYKTNPEIIKLEVMYDVRYPLSLRQAEDVLQRPLEITADSGYIRPKADIQ